MVLIPEELFVWGIILVIGFACAVAALAIWLFGAIWEERLSVMGRKERETMSKSLERWKKRVIIVLIGLALFIVVLNLSGCGHVMQGTGHFLKAGASLLDAGGNHCIETGSKKGSG